MKRNRQYEFPNPPLRAPLDVYDWIAMHDAISMFLNRLTPQLEPVRTLCERLLDEDSTIDPDSGTVLISRRPKIAPQAYACVLFPGVTKETITRYEEIHSARLALSIPRLYKEVLLHLNGAQLLELSLYGLPGSMSKTPPTLDRSKRQPLDLATANIHWRTEFKADPSQFHFGSAAYSHDENLGYFLNPDGTIEARRKNGQLFQTWPSIEIFLKTELLRVEPLYAEFEKWWDEMRQKRELEEQQKRQKKKRSVK